MATLSDRQINRKAHTTPTPQEQAKQIETGTRTEGIRKGGSRGAEENMGAGISSVLTADERG